MILHVCSGDAWEAARTSGTYRAASLDSEGFIHFSRPSQLAGTVSRHYAGVGGLVVLWVDAATLTGDDLRVENGFPHLYRPLPVDAVGEVTPLEEALERVAAR